MMQQKFRWLYLVCIFLMNTFLTTGTNRFSHLTIKDGLSQSTIKSIFQDSRGFLWFGSADGLNRYDGYKLTVYRNDPSNPSSLIGNDIICIYENPLDSVLWIGTQSEGLNMYDRKHDSFIPFRHDSKSKSSLPSNEIRSILTGIDGRLWIATSGGGMCAWNPTDSSFFQPAFSSTPQMSVINSLAAKKPGSLWMGTPNGLYHSNLKDGSVPEKIDPIPGVNLNILCLLNDVKGNLWIGTQNQGVIKYQPETRETTRYELNSGIINSFVQRKNGSVWIASSNGLYHYIAEHDDFEIFRNDPEDVESINDEVIYSLFEDRSEILWIGTFLGGINKLYPENLKFEKYNNFLRNKSLNQAINNIKGIYLDQKNTVWVATSKGLFSLKEEYFEDPKKSAGVDLIFKDVDQHHIFGDSKQNIYLSNHLGIFVLKEGTTQFQKFIPENIKSFPQFTSFNFGFEDSERMIWMITSGGLLNYNQKLNSVELKNPSNKQGIEITENFSTVAESYNGKFWLGTAEGILYVYDRNADQFGQILPSAVNPDLPFNRIFSICEQSPGLIWFGTNNGLYQYIEKDQKLKRFMSSDGLANNVVYSVIPDRKGRIWCSTNLGISVYNTQNNSFLNYTWEDGLQSNEFNQGAWFNSKDGQIYLGGIDGFNIIDPSRISPNQFIPPVAITGLSVKHKQVTPSSHPGIISHQISETKELTLKYNQSIFTFEFTALNYILSGKNQYRYKLEGYDEDWVEAGIQRTASYTNIDPGTYTFMVQGSNNDRVWNDTPTLIRINILPPFWLTWWFKSLGFLIVLFVIYLVFYLRVRKIKTERELLGKLVKEKTTALSEKNIQIENQNKELVRINEEISIRNEKIKQKNQKLNEQNEQIVTHRDNLLALAEQVQQANQAKMNFFTTISHEFRTPLTLIISPLKELITNFDEVSKIELQRKFKIIFGNASKLLLLVNQLLDFRKADTNQDGLNRSQFDLVPFVQQIAFLFNDKAQRKRINFRFVSTQKSLEVFADGGKMEKIISNLISNAFKFTPDQGEITISINHITETAGNEYFQLKVTDSGQGISEDQVSYIFNTFYQADHSQNLHQSGSGLGLALVKKYIELHGGTIDVKSKFGRGTEFTMTVPIVKPEIEQEPNQNSLENQFHQNEEILIASIDDYSPILLRENNTGNDRHLPRLLLVEDDNNLRAYLKEILSANYRIDEASNATSGLKLADTKHPDLIICDVMLPDLSGFEFCQKVKEEFKTSHIPIILLTALADLPNQMSGLKAGADAYITKPFDLQFLYLTIENLIRQRRKLQSKFYHGTKLESTEYTHNQEDQNFLDKVIGEIEKHITDTSFDVETLCREINLSQPQTYRKIKALTDLSISEFIRNIRLKKAAQILSTGNQTISEVAYEVGFSDPNYFSKCFVKVYGKTPSEFVKLKV